MKAANQPFGTLLNCHMKKLSLLLFLLWQLPCYLQAQSWLHLDNALEYVDIGDLDVSGNQLTVEAKIYQQQSSYGNIVSKHAGCSDANYLLRPYRAELTTTDGCYVTPVNCGIALQHAELSECLHVAMVYDGSSLKHYINGNLNSQVPASGNMIQNNWNTRIGTLAFPFGFFGSEQFYGYVDEVRIWNVARTESQLISFASGSIPNPTLQTGLLGYYRFNSLTNLAGNTTYNGSLIGSASMAVQDTFCSQLGGTCYVLLDAGNQENPLTIPQEEKPDFKLGQTGKKLSIWFEPQKNTAFSLSISDLGGKEVLRKRWQMDAGDSEVLAWTAGSTGIYVLRISQNGRESVHKFLLR